MQQYSVACGTGQVTFTLPPGMRADIVEPRRGTPVDLVQTPCHAIDHGDIVNLMIQVDHVGLGLVHDTTNQLASVRPSFSGAGDLE